MTEETNVGRVFRMLDGTDVRVIRDKDLYGDPLYGMVTIPLGPAHDGMEQTIWKGDIERLGLKELPKITVAPVNSVFWSCPQNMDRDDDGINVVAGGEWLTVTVSEEQAVDSYNVREETRISINREAAEELYAAIGLALGKGSAA